MTIKNDGVKIFCMDHAANQKTINNVEEVQEYCQREIIPGINKGLRNRITFKLFTQ